MIVGPVRWKVSVRLAYGVPIHSTCDSITTNGEVERLAIRKDGFGKFAGGHFIVLVRYCLLNK